MTNEEALAFLRQHQPMAPDWTLDEDVIQQYWDVRVFFLQNPDPACIPFFLNSFGQGDLYGKYTRVEEVITQFSTAEVLPHLLAALASEHLTVRYWTAQIASAFPDPQLIDSLEKLLQENDFDLSCACATALDMIGDARSVQILKAAVVAEQDEELREFFIDCLRDLGEA